jgi:aspartate aminotransferase-like enzyme
MLRKFIAATPPVQAVFLTSADTSTGVANPMGELCRIIRDHSDALIIVDSICDVGGVELRPLEWPADVVIGASQKCLMCPPGLGLATVSPRAWEAADKSDQPRFYFNWCEERKKQQTLVTASTASVSMIRALLESLRMLEEEGLPEVYARHARIGAAMRAAIAAIGLELFPDCSTDVVTVIKCPPRIDAEQFFQTLATRYGYRIAHGQEQLRGKTLRFGHMGYVTEGDLLGFLGAVEFNLQDLGFPLSGLGIAARIAAEALARSSVSSAVGEEGGGR